MQLFEAEYRRDKSYAMQDVSPLMTHIASKKQKLPEVHSFPPKKRIFNGQAPQPHCRAGWSAESKLDPMEVNEIRDITSSKRNGESNHPASSSNGKVVLDLDALTYYPAEYGDDEDASDATADDDGDEDFQVLSVVKPKRRLSSRTVTNKPRKMRRTHL